MSKISDTPSNSGQAVPTAGSLPGRRSASGRGLWRDRRGAAAVEFAIALPVLILMLMSALELAALGMAQAQLEAAVRDAARFGITGNDGTLGREVQIADIVQRQAFGLTRFENVQVTSRVYASFADVGLPEPYVDSSPANGAWDAGETFTDLNGNGSWDIDRGLPGPGAEDAIVLYRVEVRHRMLTGLLAPIFGGDRVPLTASLLVRNEPYGDPAAAPGA